MAFYKRMIMEVVPSAPGRKTNFDTILGGVSHYCSELDREVSLEDFRAALRELKYDQCICVFSDDDIRPTNFGLIRYNHQ